MWPRISAGVVPGFFAAAGLLGLLCWAWPGPWQATIVPGLLAFFPLWIGVICGSVQFASGMRAWIWLTALAISALGALWLGQTSGWLA